MYCGISGSKIRAKTTEQKEKIAADLTDEPEVVRDVGARTGGDGCWTHLEIH